MERDQRLVKLLASLSEYFEELARDHSGRPAESLRRAARFAREQPAPIWRGAAQPDVLSPTLPDLLAGTRATGTRAALLDALDDTYADLTWSIPTSYGDDDPRLAEFLGGFASTQLVGVSLAGNAGPWPDPRIRLGFTLQLPRVFYPPHAHLAEETYVVLAGDGHWRQGRLRWRQHPPGEVVFHGAHEVHAMWTQAQPLLSAFCWVKDIDSVPYLTDDQWREGL